MAEGDAGGDPAQAETGTAGAARTNTKRRAAGAARARTGAAGAAGAKTARGAANGRAGSPDGEPRSRRACCLISEILEETGLDREKARMLKRQILEGIIMLCRWQLERMDGDGGAPGAGRRARKVDLG